MLNLVVFEKRSLFVSHFTELSAVGLYCEHFDSNVLLINVFDVLLILLANCFRVFYVFSPGVVLGVDFGLEELPEIGIGLSDPVKVCEGTLVENDFLCDYLAGKKLPWFLVGFCPIHKKVLLTNF